MSGSTLVSTGELAANLTKWRVFDCRHDLAKPQLGEEQYKQGHIPGALFEREFIEAQQAAYVETALEDNEICLRLDRGRRALYESGMDDAGPYQSPMEDAEVHFHEWLHTRLDR